MPVDSDTLVVILWSKEESLHSFFRGIVCVWVCVCVLTLVLAQQGRGDPGFCLDHPARGHVLVLHGWWRDHHGNAWQLFNPAGKYCQSKRSDRWAGLVCGFSPSSDVFSIPEFASTVYIQLNQWILKWWETNQPIKRHRLSLACFFSF